jgi:DNA-binding response OmpR family regulator
MGETTRPPAAGPRVLIVEDDEVVTETLGLYLEQAGCVVCVERDGVSGLARAQQPDVALVVLDWMIPGLNGREVCRRLRAASSVPILMLTARTSEDDRVSGLQTGADDYVSKPFSAREVVARVQALLRRAGSGADAIDAVPAPPPLRIGALAVDTFQRQATVDGDALALTPTEFRLLEAFARQAGRTFTREELVGRAFGPDYDGLERTVDTHITNLRRKIEPRIGRRLIATVHGVGYRLVPADD